MKTRPSPSRTQAIRSPRGETAGNAFPLSRVCCVNNPDPRFDAEVHVVRLGDVAICTNPFELYTDYGIRIKARSKAVQTFVVELTGGPGDGSPYLPTEAAVRGGGYSAIAPSCNVGPEGGQILVERTVEAINAMWEKSN